MLFLKCRYLITALLFVSSLVLANPQRYTTKQCLDAHFDTYIKHEGNFFGLITNELWVKKSQCIIEVTYKNLLKTKWLIDICREPVHIKLTAKGSQNVHKRSHHCSDSDQNNFCTYRNDLVNILQDYGLIYAQGEREVLSTSHGQTYCAFILAKKYLDDAYIFSKYEAPIYLFGDEDTPIVGEKVVPQTLPLNPAPVVPTPGPALANPPAETPQIAPPVKGEVIPNF